MSKRALRYLPIGEPDPVPGAYTEIAFGEMTMADRWCSISDVTWSAADYGESVSCTMRLSMSRDSAMWLQAAIKMPDYIPVAQIAMNLGLQRMPIGGGGATDRVNGPTRNTKGADAYTGSGLLQAIQRSAGLDTKLSLEDTLEALEELRFAAAPPYEPKTRPCVNQCLSCKAKTIVRCNRRTGVEFTACTAWPTCKWTDAQTLPLGPAENERVDRLPKQAANAPAYAKRKLEFDE